MGWLKRFLRDLNKDRFLHFMHRLQEIEKNQFELRCCDDLLNSKLIDLNERIMFLEKVVGDK